MHLIQNCNCSSPIVPSLKKMDDCNNKDEILCSQNYYIKKFMASDVKECISFCPLECEFFEYKTKMSALPLLGDQFINYIQNNTNLSSDFSKKSIDSFTASQSFVHVNIFYDSLSYSLIKESPKTNLFSLLAWIGGNLSIILSINLFSFLEIIQVLIEIYYIKTT